MAEPEALTTCAVTTGETGEDAVLWPIVHDTKDIVVNPVGLTVQKLGVSMAGHVSLNVNVSKPELLQVIDFRTVFGAREV